MACGAVRLTGLSEFGVLSGAVLNWPVGCRKPLLLRETILGLDGTGRGKWLSRMTVQLLGRQGKILFYPALSHI